MVISMLTETRSTSEAKKNIKKIDKFLGYLDLSLELFHSPFPGKTPFAPSPLSHLSVFLGWDKFFMQKWFLEELGDKMGWKA